MQKSAYWEPKNIRSVIKKFCLLQRIEQSKLLFTQKSATFTAFSQTNLYTKFILVSSCHLRSYLQTCLPSPLT